jgi:GT2 family glycosyltransferase
MSFRKEAILNAGMSDERFSGMGYGEDTDLSLRVGQLGYTLLFDPAIKLLHLQIKTGGCQLRDSAQEDRVDDEHCRLRLYLSLKHAGTFGLRKTLSSVWENYRSYAFNRTIVRSPSITLLRHYRFGRNLLRAGLMSTRPVRHMPPVTAFDTTSVEYLPH